MSYRRPGFPVAVLFALVLPLLAACLASEPEFNAPGAGVKVYPMTEEQAEAVIRRAMLRSFSDSVLVKINQPYKGYSATISFAIDRHSILATLIKAKGRRPDGTLVSGYYFSIAHYGTILISGPIRARKAATRIHRYAREIVKPLPLAVDD